MTKSYNTLIQMNISDDTTTLVNTDVNEDRTQILTHAELLKYLPADNMTPMRDSAHKKPSWIQYLFSLLTFHRGIKF